MSILTNIEDTLNEGSLHIIKNKLFEKLYCDARNIIRKTTNYTIAYNAYIASIHKIILTNMEEIKLYDLVNEFELCADDIELFCTSKYIKEIPGFYVYDYDLGISFNTNFDIALNYLKNNVQVEQDYMKYVSTKNINFYETNYNIYLNSFKKSILNINIYFSDEFINELKDFIKEYLHK